MASGRGAGLVGVLVTGGALALAELLAALAAAGPSPVEAVAEAFIDRTPAWLKDWAIAVFGTADKAALGVGIALVLLALAVVAGVAESRRRGAGAALVLALGLVAALATTSRPDGGAAAAWPVSVSAVVGALVLSAMLRPTAPAAAPAGMPAGAPAPVPPEAAERAMADRRLLDRRALLLSAGVIGAAAVVGASVSRVMAGRSVDQLPRALPDPVRTPAPGVDLDVPGLTPFRTPTEEFYRIDTAFFVPQVDPGDWELRVHGMVDQEVRISLAELLEEPMVEAWVTLACVSNPVGGDLVGNATWLGLPVRDLLSRAGVQPGADMVLSRSVDGFSASTPLEVLTDERNALIAVAMNGEPLPPEHGYPVRMVVPGLFGYVSATKWLTELEVTRFDEAAAYWTERGWAPRGPVKISSRIDVPTGSRELAPGPVAVAGVAWAQHTGIDRVEVRVDGGPWEPAELAEQVSADTWRQWVHRWQATPGRHTLEVRATDRDGLTQTGERAGVVPDGATGWHAVDVTVAG